jgi:aerobic carbon-monoxide dehydrogenase medium subunit
VRNVATIGGSLAHADPHMDMPPVLIALGAHVTVMGPAGERTIPVEQLFAGYYETVLARNELITSVVIPAQREGRAVYLKCTTRAVHDWPALGVAVAVESDGATVRDARVVVSAATETPGRLTGVEQALRGGRAGDALWRAAGEAAAKEAQTISDGQGSAAYKRQLVRVYVARALAAALKPGGAN